MDRALRVLYGTQMAHSLTRIQMKDFPNDSIKLRTEVHEKKGKSDRRFRKVLGGWELTFFWKLVRSWTEGKHEPREECSEK